ncbi:MAG: response regulator [Desulfamplus sp.]|nr:response regulator [Desulfamplus sp.]
MQILYVNDDEQISKLMCTFFSINGHDVILVSHVQAAIETVKEKRPDVIFWDVCRHDHAAMTAIDQLKSSRETRNIQSIVMTGEVDATTHSSFYASGADGIMTKPFDLRALAKQIDLFARTSEWGDGVYHMGRR